MDRRLSQVSGFGGFDCDTDGFSFAHLPDKDDIHTRTAFPLHEAAFLIRQGHSVESSMVMILQRFLRFIRSTVEARVVDLPLPVIPVTNTNPRSAKAVSPNDGGNPGPSIAGRACGMRRRTEARARR